MRFITISARYAPLLANIKSARAGQILDAAVLSSRESESLKFIIPIRVESCSITASELPKSQVKNWRLDGRPPSRKEAMMTQLEGLLLRKLYP